MRLAASHILDDDRVNERLTQHALLRRDLLDRDPRLLNAARRGIGKRSVADEIVRRRILRWLGSPAIAQWFASARRRAEIVEWVSWRRDFRGKPWHRRAATRRERVRCRIDRSSSGPLRTNVRGSECGRRGRRIAERVGCCGRPRVLDRLLVGLLPRGNSPERRCRFDGWQLDRRCSAKRVELGLAANRHALAELRFIKWIGFEGRFRHLCRSRRWRPRWRGRWIGREIGCSHIQERIGFIGRSLRCGGRFVLVGLSHEGLRGSGDRRIGRLGKRIGFLWQSAGLCIVEARLLDRRLASIPSQCRAGVRRVTTKIQARSRRCFRCGGRVVGEIDLWLNCRIHRSLERFERTVIFRECRRFGRCRASGLLSKRVFELERVGLQRCRREARRIAGRAFRRRTSGTARVIETNGRGRRRIQALLSLIDRHQANPNHARHGGKLPQSADQHGNPFPSSPPVVRATSMWPADLSICRRTGWSNFTNGNVSSDKGGLSIRRLRFGKDHFRQKLPHARGRN